MRLQIRAQYAVRSGILVLCAVMFGLAPVVQGSEQQQRGERADAAAAAESTVTIVGCLQEERNVAGRRPNIFERIGIAEDFILTGATVEGREPSPVGTSGSADQAAEMYQIVGLDDERLRQHTSRRVEVTGRIQPRLPRAAVPEVPIAEGTQTGTQPRPLPPTGRGESRATDEPLPRVHAADIREIAGDCSPNR